MSIDELIDLLQARLTYTWAQRVAASQRGDIATIQKLDADLASTQGTLAQLQALVAQGQ
jgi:hypothetical protein